MALNGEQGYSRKSDGPGNASHYYSLTRLDTTGAIEIDAPRHEVHGSSRLDREWSTSTVADAQEGWDRFALPLSAGELMFYRLRRKEGGRDTLSPGTVRVLESALATDSRTTTQPNRGNACLERENNGLLSLCRARRR